MPLNLPEGQTTSPGMTGWERLYGWEKWKKKQTWRKVGGLHYWDRQRCRRKKWGNSNVHILHFECAAHTLERAINLCCLSAPTLRDSQGGMDVAPGTSLRSPQPQRVCTPVLVKSRRTIQILHSQQRLTGAMKKNNNSVWHSCTKQDCMEVQVQSLWHGHVLRCNTFFLKVARIRSQSVLPLTVRFHNRTGYKILTGHSLATMEARSTTCFTKITEFVGWNPYYISFNNPH